MDENEIRILNAVLSDLQDLISEYVCRFDFSDDEILKIFEDAIRLLKEEDCE